MFSALHGDHGTAKHQRQFKRRVRHNGGGDMWKNIQFPPWVASNVDILSEILGRLPPVQMLQATIVSRPFKRIITSHGFRCLVRTTVRQPGHLLGLFPKCNANKRERYPFIQCSGSADPIPRPLRNASLSVLRFWKPANYWRHFELLDSRDGKLLLLAGKSSRNVEMVVFYPQSSTNQYDLIPRLAVLDEANIRLVTAALIPDEKSHHFSVIVLTRRGVTDSQMKPEVPVAESSVICYTSSNGRWGNPVTTQFEMPAKKMLRLGSVLVGRTLHFLHSCKQVIKVNVETLELGKLKLPRVTNICSRTAHVLARGLTGNQLYLAVVSGRDIATYTHSSTGWDPALLLPGPISAPFVAIKLVGSAEAGGLILVKVDGRVIVTMEVETGKDRQITDDLREEEVLCYELEFPPVSQMLRQQQPED